MQTRTQQRSEEDIEAVLGRFHAWTGARETNTPSDGVRELSYEEAVGSSRYRRRKSPGIPPVKTASAVPPPDTPRVSASTVARAPVKPQAAQTRAPAAKVSSHAAAKSPARKKAAPQQPFRAVLAQSMAPAVSKPTRAIANEERQVAMSVRMAASEQALVRLRAAAAGLSVSAYLRQCALDVEILRGQMQQFMTASALSRMAELAAPATAPAALSVRSEGWFTRLRRVWDGRGTQLSLKA
jgi:hypothetical protein